MLKKNQKYQNKKSRINNRINYLKKFIKRQKKINFLKKNYIL